jgi:predicted phage terminase large subunit-like protein
MTEAELLRFYAQYLEDERLSPEERERIGKSLRLLTDQGRGDPQLARERFIPYVKQVWPKYIHGRHHDILADVFERIERGECKRAVVNLPPRSTKSRFASVLFPSWYLGRHPDHKVMECSHTASLALDFGRDVRNLIHSPEYRRIFPKVSLSQDARAAYRWNTNHGGQYFAIGKSGAAAGRGGDLIVVDDPHSEQDIAGDPKAEFEKTWKWFSAGPRQRLQPGGAILIVMTRWGVLDLTGQIRKQYIESDDDGERWEFVQLPAILPSGESLFPQFWDIAELKRTRAVMPPARWAANYMQEPVSEEGAIIKKEWWMDYPNHTTPPPIDIKVMAWDTAFSAKTSADRSAMVLWGTFTERLPDQSLRHGACLLDAWAGRLDFPALKMKARELYDCWKPDYMLIEAKGTGRPLIQELWRMGIPCDEANPHRTWDKHIRTNAVADMFRGGMVWAPLGLKWVEEVRDEMSAFPFGANDDLHDAAVYGLLHIRNGGLLRLNSDLEEEEYIPRPVRQYY